jgi:hypothetical protein
MPVQSRARIEDCRADAFIPVQAVDTVTAQEGRSGGAEGWGRSDLAEGATAFGVTRVFLALGRRRSKILAI